MFNKWKCPICGNKKALIIRKNMWNFSIFFNKYLITCEECKTSSMYPMPKSEELEDINKLYWTKYQKIDKKSEDVAKIRSLSMINYINKFSNQPKFDQILDVGSGLGYIIDALKKQHIESYNYYAVEQDILAKNVLYSKGTRVVYPNINNVDLNNFSLIILSHIIEHLPNPKKFLAFTKTLLKEEGFLFIEVPNQEDQYKGYLGLHTFVFNEYNLTYLLKSLNFNILNTASTGLPLTFLKLMNNNYIVKFLRTIYKDSTSKVKKESSKDIIYLASLRRILFLNFINSRVLNKYGGNRQYLRILAIKQ